MTSPTLLFAAAPTAYFSAFLRDDASRPRPLSAEIQVPESIQAKVHRVANISPWPRVDFGNLW
jgi:hypothetical protein